MFINVLIAISFMISLTLYHGQTKEAEKVNTILKTTSTQHAKNVETSKSSSNSKVEVNVESDISSKKRIFDKEVATREGCILEDGKFFKTTKFEQHSKNVKYVGYLIYQPEQADRLNVFISKWKFLWPEMSFNKSFKQFPSEISGKQHV